MFGNERRRFPRLQAQAYFRPAGVRALVQDWQNRVRDISLGGVGVYSDEHVAVGDALELEIFQPGSDSFTVTTKVARIERLADDAPARYDVGLVFVSMSEEVHERLRAILLK
jgi:c-di-GMP-binding flagellar brake protein YcgR